MRVEIEKTASGCKVSYSKNFSLLVSYDKEREEWIVLDCGRHHLLPHGKIYKFENARNAFYFAKRIAREIQG